MAITPRHYLDFINQYANLFNEKRSELEEQQMHLNVGLRKIKETVDQVVFKCGLIHPRHKKSSTNQQRIILSFLALVASLRWKSFVEI